MPDRKKNLPRLLITGISGFLGWNAALELRSRFNITGWYFKHKTAIQGVSLQRCDLTDRQELEKRFNDTRPEFVIHAAAMSKPDDCEIHPVLSRIINVEASGYLSELCSNCGSALVFTSSDLVFDGKTGFYSEESAVNPQSVYAEHKVQAEQVIRDIWQDAVICRCPLMYGWTPPASNNQWPSLLKKLDLGEKVILFNDQYRSMASVRSVVQGLEIGLQNHGMTLHLGGRERLSRYEFGLAAARAVGYSTEQVASNSMFDFPAAAKRPQDVSLNSEKAYSLGYQPGTVQDEMMKLIGSTNNQNCN